LEMALCTIVAPGSDATPPMRSAVDEVASLGSIGGRGVVLINL
jgi:hypothetical protein